MADLSLDQIIANSRKNKKTGRGNASVNPPQKRGGREYAKKYSSNDSAFTKLTDVPMGKWGHDGYEEMYGAGHSDDDGSYRNLSVPMERVVTRKVKILITDLADSVTTADLTELFEAFHLDSVDVHYNEAQESVGIAYVTTDSSSAKEMMKQFKGVRLDGKPLKMHLIDESDFEGVSGTRRSGIMGRVTYSKSERPRSPPRARLQGVSKPYVKANIRGGGHRRNEPTRREKGHANTRKQMTQEELDKELDEYMKRGSSS